MPPEIWLLAAIPVLLAAGAWSALAAADRRGRKLVAAGRATLDLLRRLSTALEEHDTEAIARCYGDEFSGTDLGLDRPSRVAERDGVQTFAFPPGGKPRDRRAAVLDWASYLESFHGIEEVALHIERFTRRRPRELRLVARFELIGTPRGANQAGIDRARFALRLRRSGAGELAIHGASLLDGQRVIGQRPHFVAIGEAAGVAFLNRPYPGFLSEPLRFAMIRHGPAGITAVDYDNDGYCDLFIPDGVSARLLRNRRDGTFEDVTERAGLGGLDGVSVGIFGDYDNDGWKDLFVSRTFRPNQLFHNNGDGTFTDVTASSGLGADNCTTAASWGDYDNDGRLDLYVGRYVDPRHDLPTTFYARNGEANRLYHNSGDGTFTDATAEAGVGDTGLCLATSWGDYDDDGYPDLFVSNDFGRSTLYHNNGDGTFTDVTVRAGALAYGAGMNASWADYDNDGRLDLFETDIRSEHAWFAEPITIFRHVANCIRQGVWRTDLPLYFEIFRQSGWRFLGVFREMASGNHLLRNRGDGTFQDVSTPAAANPPGWFWGAAFADFDNDGWLDVYVANGWVRGDRGTEIELDFLDNVVGRQPEYKRGVFFDPATFSGRSWHGWERNRYLRNCRDGTFEEIGRGAGIDLLLNSRGVAAADFWNRGAVDLVLSASGDRHDLLRNQIGAGRNWLQVDLVGTRSNRDAVGARISVLTGGRPQTREVCAGEGYASQNPHRQHFGLGDHAVVDSVTVTWPASGIVDRLLAVPANQIVRIVEGGSRLLTR